MSTPQREQFNKALLALLVPLARLVLRSGVTYREFAGLAKRAFVDVAMQEFGKRGRLTNISRVAVMTGLTRKEVSNIKDETPVDIKQTFDVKDYPNIGKNLSSEILRRWYTDSSFMNSNGEPAPLQYSGTSPSFMDLVRCCDRDIPPGAVREELLRVGAILVTGDGNILPSRREYIPQKELERIIEGVGYGLRMQAETIAHNATVDDLKNLRFQRVASSSRIPQPKLAALEQRISEQLSEFLKEIDDKIASQESAQDDAVQEEFAVGCYIYRSNRKQ